MAGKDTKEPKDDPPPIEETPIEDDSEFTRRILRETHAQQVQQTQMLTKVASSIESLTSLLLMSNVFPREAMVLLDHTPSVLTDNRPRAAAHIQATEEQPPTASDGAAAANIRDGPPTDARHKSYIGSGARPTDNSTGVYQPLRGYTEGSSSPENTQHGQLTDQNLLHIQQQAKLWQHQQWLLQFKQQQQQQQIQQQMSQQQNDMPTSQQQGMHTQQQTTGQQQQVLQQQQQHQATTQQQQQQPTNVDIDSFLNHYLQANQIQMPTGQGEPSYPTFQNACNTNDISNSNKTEQSNDQFISSHPYMFIHWEGIRDNDYGKKFQIKDSIDFNEYIKAYMSMLRAKNPPFPILGDIKFHLEHIEQLAEDNKIKN